MKLLDPREPTMSGCSVFLTVLGRTVLVQEGCGAHLHYKVVISGRRRLKHIVMRLSVQLEVLNCSSGPTLLTASKAATAYRERKSSFSLPTEFQFHKERNFVEEENGYV